MTTMASGRSRSSAGMSTRTTKARNTAVLVAAATVMAAQMPWSPSAPIRVSRCQRPPGAVPCARWPCRARACVRTKRVSNPLSSMKISRAGSISAASACHVARAVTTSTRSCSHARSVFAYAPSPTSSARGAVEPSYGSTCDHRRAPPLARACGQQVGILGQRRVGALRHQRTQRLQPAPQWGRATPQRQRRPPPFVVRLASLRPDARLLPPETQRRNTDAELTSRLRATASGILAGQQSALAQVNRVGPRHVASAKLTQRSSAHVDPPKSREICSRQQP